MIVTTSFENAPARDVGVTGQVYRLWEFVGRAPVRGTYVEGNEANDNALPQGFLVQQPPGSVTRPHFHETNQFQVFVGGGGHFGKRPAAPLTVQYASGHTPYGPISANDEGLLYYTLRQRWDPGAKYARDARSSRSRKTASAPGTGRLHPPSIHGHSHVNRTSRGWSGGKPECRRT